MKRFWLFFFSQALIPEASFVCEQFDCMTAMVDLCKLKNDPNNQKTVRTAPYPDLLALNYNDKEIQVEKFVQRSQQWSLLENIPINRRWFGAELIDTQLYIFGGENVNGTELNTVIYSTR